MFGEITRDEVFRLETRRLWLRWPRLADAPAITDFACRIEVAKTTANIPHPYPEGAAADFIAKAAAANAAGSGLFLVMTEKYGARPPVGLISINDRIPNRGWLAYLVTPSHWGKGYATEAVRAIVDATFQITSAPAVATSVFVGNDASTRVLIKSGFASLGQDQQNAPARGGFVTVERFSLSRTLWAGENSSFEARKLAACCA